MIKGLRFFRRTSKVGCYNIAGYHDPRSITWSWVLGVDFTTWFRRPTWHIVSHSCRRWSIHIPFVCTFHFHTQRKMMRSTAIGAR